VITNLLLLLGIRRNGSLARTSKHWLLPIGYMRLVGALLVLGLLANLSASSMNPSLRGLTSELAHEETSISADTFPTIPVASCIQAVGTNPCSALWTIASRNTQLRKLAGNLHLVAHSPSRFTCSGDKIPRETSSSSGNVFRTSKSQSKQRFRSSIYVDRGSGGT